LPAIPVSSKMASSSASLSAPRKQLLARLSFQGEVFEVQRQRLRRVGGSGDASLAIGLAASCLCTHATHAI
jgi:hypothetical protein